MRRLRALAAMLTLLLSLAAPTAAGPELTVAAPKEGEVIQGSSITVTFTTANIKLVPTTVPVSEAGKHPEANKPGEGHLHFVLDLQPLVVWEKGDPYTFQSVPPGAHQLMVELVNNDHSSLSPRVMRMIQFRVAPGALPVTAAAGSDSGLNLLFLALLLIIGGRLVLQSVRTRSAAE